MIDPGRRDRLVKFQRFLTTGRDRLNNPTGIWSEYAMAWAEKRDVSDRERMAAGELSAEMSTRFRVNWTPTLAQLTAKDRIVCGDLHFDVIGVKEIGTREEIEITAARRADQ